MAEKETLLYLLDTDLCSQYEQRIVASTRSQLFFCKHTFVQEARLSATGITFDFSPDTESPGPFAMKLELVHERGADSPEREIMAKDKLQVKFKRPLDEYVIRLWLDGHLAYANGYVNMEEQIPF